MKSVSSLYEGTRSSLNEGSVSSSHREDDSSSSEGEADPRLLEDSKNKRVIVSDTSSSMMAIEGGQDLVRIRICEEDSSSEEVVLARGLRQHIL